MPEFLFLGEKKYEGLYTKPVIRLDMRFPSGSASKEILEKKICSEHRRNAKRHNLALWGVDLGDTFASLITDVKEAHPKMSFYWLTNTPRQS
ncbi:MAG: hypothetical protein LBU69_00915 [Deltaproteobacteria bacterium]|jgi:hypothetical protein|nr:hypothetical protein [Deltaproteobacteria bacterium]